MSAHLHFVRRHAYVVVAHVAVGGGAGGGALLAWQPGSKTLKLVEALVTTMTVLLVMLASVVVGCHRDT